MNLSPHFTLWEFTASETAARRGIRNLPDDGVLENLRLTAERLEIVREILATPIVITSGYRSLALNRAIGSRDTSAHVLGLAVDFTAPGFGSPLQVAERLAMHRDRLAYDQLIHEFRRWVHIGFSDGVPRRQLLTIDSSGTRAGLLA